MAVCAAMIDANASPPTPQKQSVRNSRRFRAYRICSAISVHVKKRVEVENGEGELLHLRGIVGTSGEELHRERLLVGARNPPGRQTPRAVDALRRRSTLLQQSRRESPGEIVRRLPVQQLERLRGV